MPVNVNDLGICQRQGILGKRDDSEDVAGRDRGAV